MSSHFHSQGPSWNSGKTERWHYSVNKRRLTWSSPSNLMPQCIHDRHLVCLQIDACSKRASERGECVCQPTFWCDAWTGPLEVERRSSALRILSNLRMDSSSTSQTTLHKGCSTTCCITPFYCQLGLEPIPSTSPHSPRPAKHPGPSCGPKSHSIPSTTQPSFRLQSGSVCARPNFHEQVSTRCRPPAARCSLTHSTPQHPRLLGGEASIRSFGCIK